MKNTRLLASLTLSLSLALSAGQALAVDEHYVDGAAAVGGYDVIAYHTDGKPMKGSGGLREHVSGRDMAFRIPRQHGNSLRQILRNMRPLMAVGVLLALAKEKKFRPSRNSGPSSTVNSI